MTAQTDQVRTIREAREQRVVATDREGGEEALVARGRLRDFRCACATVRDTEDGLALSADAGEALGVEEGETVWRVPRWL